MAWERDVFSIPALEAASDLSTKQFYCVRIEEAAAVAQGVNLRVSVCDTAGEVVLGVLQNKPNAAGAAASVRALGVTKVVADEALYAGMTWGTSADGQAAWVQATNTGADTRSYVAGMVLESAAAAALATVTIGFPAFQVSA